MTISPQYTTLKAVLASLSFAVAMIIATVALFLPPTGVIDSSVLWLTSQALVFCATMLGLSLNIDGLKQIASNMPKKKEEPEEDA